ncbi:PREDICTED: zinc metalloproteinase dpy-31-like [Amphimedon queenslandica]|uniref:Metalloendopeptidase n=1 Tax=Amphimedon queenslandica TaxID=400682 RepID=A0AAN0JKE2_AMPQE|nr:PREDICTED: zinc metalloproteinase dpy-31-like [Amphimedon queenslandica]|eukprot:XP_019857173.1 PREDICTED: zinc metalloproteinase dpy-31-like [Amphimedon queenslandica]
MRLIIAFIICMIVNVISVEIPPADYFDEDIENESCPEVERAEDEEDLVLIDGDILVTKEQAAIYYESGWDGLVNSQNWMKLNSLNEWSKTIPHEIDQQFVSATGGDDKSIKSNIFLSLKALQDKTCLKFPQKRCSDPYYLSFVKGDSCSTYLGKPFAGARVINLKANCAAGTDRKMTPAHEVMHALGRAHEHQRADRNRYVTIAYWNTCNSQMTIKEGFRTFNQPYDYYSIMHYSPKQCQYYSYTSLAYQDSMTFTSQLKGSSSDVGQRGSLSPGDIQHIKRVYCPSVY